MKAIRILIIVTSVVAIIFLILSIFDFSCKKVLSSIGYSFLIIDGILNIVNAILIAKTRKNK